jgi:4-amino-4-deoxy-L-arabinose transferase-like glycosyltransferase
LGDYLLGLAFFAGTSGTVAAASALFVRRRLTSLRGAPALLAGAVLATAGVVAVHLAPGVLGLLSRPSALLCGLALFSLTAFWLRGSRASKSPTRPRADALGPSLLVAGVAASSVAVFWLARAWEALGDPTRHIDTLTFHLPDVARWIQTGSLWGVHQFVPLQVDGYYPQTGDLVFLAVVMPWMNDAFVNVVNVAFAAVAALAAYAIARELGARRAQSLLAGALFLSIPALIVTAFKGAQTDTIMVAMLGGGILFLLRHARTGRRSDLLLGGLGLGLAFGSKWSGVSSVVAVVVVWTIALLLARRPVHHVLRGLGAVTGIVVAAGGFWLLRNWVSAGNPLFPVDVQLAGLTVFDAPRHLLGECANFSVASYLGDGGIWRRYLAPEYREALSLAGLATLVAAPVTAALAVRAGRSRGQRGRAALVLVVAAGVVVLTATYAVTPGSALGLRDLPVNVAGQARYLLPALLLGSALAGWGLHRLGRWSLPFEVLTLGVIAVSLAAAFELGPALLISVAVGLGAVTVAVGLATLVAQRSANRPLGLALAAVAVVGVIAVGYERQGEFNEGRYQGLDPTLDWILERAPQGREIALAGRWTVRGPGPVLPAFGPRLGNEVGYLGEFVRGHLREYEDPSAWRRALVRGGYDLVLVGRGGYGGRLCPIPGAAGDDDAWARASGLSAVARSARFTLYRVPPPGA